MMKSVLFPILFVTFFLGRMLGSETSPPHDVVLASPDHPATWFAGGDYLKLDQVLKWDRRRQTLYLDVTYTLNGQFQNQEDPDLLHTFRVSFPGVRTDSTGTRLYAFPEHGRPVPFARVMGGPLGGERTEPDSNVEMIAHRHEGHLFASLVIHAE